MLWYTLALMNTLEWILWASAVVITALYVSWRFRDWRVTLFIVAAMAVPLIMSMDRMTQFLTIDEPYFTFEINTVRKTDDLRFWYEHGGKFRTSYVLYGLPMQVFGRFTPNWTDAQDFRLLRIASWYVSYGLLLLTHYLIDKHLLERKVMRAPFFLVFAVTYLLFPINDIIFRTFSYDTLSLQLGLLAVFLMIIAFKQQSRRMGLLAVVVAFLATQEKPIATPILFMVVPLFACLAVRIDAEGQRRGIWWVRGPLQYLGLAIGITLLISAAQATILLILRDFRDGVSIYTSLFDPYTAWAQSVSTFTFGFEVSSTGNILVLLITIAVFYVSTLAVLVGILLLDRLHAERWLKPMLMWSSGAALLLLIGLGLYGILGVEARLSGLLPVPDGLYVPTSTNPFQGGPRYFGAETFWLHTLSYVSYHYGMMLADMPTAIWLLAGWSLILAFLMRAEDTQARTKTFDIQPTLSQFSRLLPRRPQGMPQFALAATDVSVEAPPLINPVWERNVTGTARAKIREANTSVGLYLALLAGLALPLGFGLLSIPFPIPYSSRYMSLGTSLAIIMLVLLLWRRASVMRPAWQYAIAIGYAALFIIELLPFAPMYGAFRPIWLEPSPEAETGVAVQAWGGWGEEVMLTGEMIFSECGQASAPSDAPAWSTQPCEGIRLYSSFPGVWFRSHTDMLNTSPAVAPRDFNRETDYWVINRTAVIIGWASMPELEPEAVLTYRGYPYAWVYQGSELAEIEHFGSDQPEP